LEVKVLKVAHHGSKYATSDEFLQHVKPEVAIISDGEFNRYGHPSPLTLNRLKANGVTKLYRTDLNGDINITSNGKTYEIKAAKETKSGVVWAGREAQKDDSSRSGFITYGDFGPPPKAKKQ
jgi:beta-lactamase superfamily II metal-dependent hydrolase